MNKKHLEKISRQKALEIEKKLYEKQDNLDFAKNILINTKDAINFILKECASFFQFKKNHQENSYHYQKVYYHLFKDLDLPESISPQFPTKIYKYLPKNMADFVLTSIPTIINENIDPLTSLSGNPRADLKKITSILEHYHLANDLARFLRYLIRIIPNEEDCKSIFNSLIAYISENIQKNVQESPIHRHYQKN